MNNFWFPYAVLFFSSKIFSFCCLSVHQHCFVVTQLISFQILKTFSDLRKAKILKNKIPVTQWTPADCRPGLVRTISSCVKMLMRPHTCCQRPCRPGCSAGQSDRRTSAGINRHLSQALFQLMCRSLTGSSGSIHLLLIPSRHQSLNADPPPSHTHTHSWCWTLLRWESFGVSCWLRLNEMIITLHLAHVTELCLSLSTAPALTLTDSTSGRFMLMQIVGGHLVVHGVCACMHVLVCQSTTSIHDVTSSSRAAPSYFRQPSTVFSSSSAESGDTYQRQVLSIFSIASGICLLGVACMALYRRNKWVTHHNFDYCSLKTFVENMSQSVLPTYPVVIYRK